MEENNQIRISVCVTTMNASVELDNCLRSLWISEVKPDFVVVSDDSSDPKIQQQNQNITQYYPETIYVIGPHQGVCANRNCAFRAVPPTDLVAFIDDDICVEPDFVAKVIARYQTLSPKIRRRTFLTGGTPTKLSFRGYFSPSKEPRCVDLHTAVFPVAFFQVEKWDEKIFFGYEDAILCLKAIKNGFEILHCPELKVNDTRLGESTLNTGGMGKLTQYEIYIEAARLYVGIERYKNIFPNRLKLITFLLIYFIHMNIFLFRKNAIKAWSEIIKYSHF